MVLSVAGQWGVFDNQGGILQNGMIKDRNVWINDLDAGKTAPFEKEFAVNIAADISELCRNSDIIVISIKPDGFNYLLQELRAYLETDQVIVSVAAGINTAYIEKKYWANKE